MSARVATKPKRTTPVPEAASNGARALTGAAEANDAHPPEVSNGIGNFTPDRLGPLYHALMQAGARLVACEVAFAEETYVITRATNGAHP